MKNLSRLLTFVFAVFLLCLAQLSWSQTLVAGASARAGGRDTVDRLIVKLRQAAAPGRLSAQQKLIALSTKSGVRLSHLRAMSGGSDVLLLEKRLKKTEAEAVARQLAADPDVEYAEPDLPVHAALLPNDGQYVNQWHYKAPGDEIGGINLPPAWDITTGAANISVAVIDTGILPHAEFAGRTLPGFDFISDVPVANDGDGRDANPVDPGDWITAEENAGTAAGGYFAGCGVSNSSWHGAHVAGTVGAASNNAQGVAGVNWTSKILPVRVLGKCGGYTSDVVDGMRWAAGLAVPGVAANPNAARVLNLSLSGAGACGLTLQSAVNEIVNAGKVIVVAAGNQNADAMNSSPGNCAGVITVAATNRAGGKAYYSNYGAGVEIAAPGGAQSFANDPNGILSTLNSGLASAAADDYRYYQGTSMATPHVSGLVSLMLSANPGLTPAQVLNRLQTTARAFPGAGCGAATCGAGIANAAAAVGDVSRLIKLSSAVLNFGDVTVGTGGAPRTFQLTNTNTASTALGIGAASISGANATDFTLSTNTCSGATLAPRAQCAISVVFKPTAAGVRTAQVTVAGNAANSPQRVNLSGTGLAAATLQFGAANYWMNEAGTRAAITVTRKGDLSKALTVNYATGNGTASAGADYTAASGVISFAAGDGAPKTFFVPITNDPAVETNETVRLSLSNPGGGASLGTPAAAVLTIVNDDTSVQFSTGYYAVNEGVGNAIVTVTRSGNLTRAVTVNYATSNGSVVAGGDYVVKSGTVSFAAGNGAPKGIAIPIINDRLVEPTEIFRVTLHNPSGAVLGARSDASIAIINND
ncbi:MAG: S8 family serine peptidase [Pseudomonadota bacterium]